MRAIVHLMACAALGLPAIAHAVTANYADWWWNDQQSGHGLNIGQQNDVLFVSWFTYDETGAGMWLTLSATLAGTRASGNWVRTTGPALGTPFDPAKITRTVVGTGTLTFGSLHDATLDWTVNGKSGLVTLTRMSWATRSPNGAQAGRIYLNVAGCVGGTPLNVPIGSTYTTSGSTLTVVDDYRPTGTKVCTMTGTLVPSGSYLFVSGTYTCTDNPQTGAWQGTILVRDQLIARDEVLTIDGSACVDVQSVVTSPLP
jgi:hypothetical protein